MDPDTAAAYAKAYHLTTDAVLDWWRALPSAVQPVIARCFKQGRTPNPHDGPDWIEQHKLYEQGLKSFGEFVFESFMQQEQMVTGEVV